MENISIASAGDAGVYAHVLIYYITYYIHFFTASTLAVFSYVKDM